MPTKHDKARLVTKHFNEILGMQVQEVVVDTDVFGTFSGEIERVGTPLETAIKKARVGIKTTNNPFAIASEGSVGPDPIFGLVNANIETMVFVDDELGIQVHETIKSNEIVAFSTTTLKMDLGIFLEKADFPIIFIDVSISQAANRIGFNKDRPLLLINPRQQWMNLMSERRPVYEKLATDTVSSDSKKPHEVAKVIVEKIKAKI